MVRLCRRGLIVRALRQLGVLALLLAAVAAPAPTALAQQGPHEIGQWDPFVDGGQDYVWPPGFTMHAVRLPEAKVLAWFDAAEGHSQPQLWDRVKHQFTEISANLPLGCSGHAQLWGSPLLAGGGNPDVICYPSVNNATRFQLADPSGWVQVAPMTYERWYPTCTTLPEVNKVLITSGHRDVLCTALPDPPPDPCDPNDCPRYMVPHPEVYDLSTNSWTVLSNAYLPLQYYPFMFVNTDGRVFMAGPGTPGHTYILNVQTQVWDFVSQSAFGIYGLSASLGAAVMYEPGKVLKCGGRTDPPEGALLSLSAVIDLRFLDQDAHPPWNFETPGFMVHQGGRLNHNGVLLADGSVLLVGGNELGPSPDYDPNGGPAIHQAELWRPWLAQGWELMATMQKDRVHHSIALLLDDATVLSTSGDTEYFPNDPHTAEIYSPPYLFLDAQGTPAQRPRIGFAPTSVHYGDTFSITLARGSPVTSGQISKVTLLRLGSNTHGFDMDQRFLLLAGPPPANPPTVVGDNLTVVAPANANLAPPGNYMLFVISNTGVPSVASDIWLGPASVPW